MTFEEEVAAGVFVTSYCLRCGRESPAAKSIRECCETGKQDDLARFQFPTSGQEKP